MTELDVLDQLEKAKGPKAKGAILKANKDNKKLAELLDAAMNFDRRFYIKKFEIASTSGTQHVDSHKAFMELLRKLETREVTGNDAQIEVAKFFCGCYSAQESKWYSRIIKKDLRCDFGISLANANGFKLHEFEVMLAKDGKECKKLEEIVNAGVYASPKFNGYRALAICDHGDVLLMSRNGLPYTNFPHIVEELQRLSANSKFILDGEMMSDDFNAMQQTAMSSKSKKSVGDVKYYVFGWIPWDEWQDKIFFDTTSVRLQQLSEWFDNNPSELIVKVEHKLISSLADALQFEKDCLALKYEGAMLLPDIPYYCGKKSNRLLKLKTFVSMDCPVVGFYEGEGRNAGRMGGVVVMQEDGVTTCEVGSGWNDEEREYMWQNQAEFLGRILEVQYQEIGAKGRMQFPTVVRWRDNGTGSKM
jgi:DNA ligase-1